MDKKDEKIIEMLRENARRPFTDIAEELDVSEATVRKRVQNLEENEIIKKYTINVDTEKIGYNTLTLLGLDVEPDKLLEACEKIAEVEEVKKVYTATGDHMIMSEVWARDNTHLSEILSQKIGEIDGVKNLCPAIILEEIKN